MRAQRYSHLLVVYPALFLLISVFSPSLPLRLSFSQYLAFISIYPVASTVGVQFKHKQKIVIVYFSADSMIVMERVRNMVRDGVRSRVRKRLVWVVKLAQKILFFCLCL